MSKVGRNEPCPCGSGKKYKKCCLRGPSEHRKKLESVDQALETATEWLLERHPQDLKEAVESQYLDFLPDEDVEAFANLSEDVRQLVSINAYEWALAEGWARASQDSTPLIDLVLGTGGPLMDADQRQHLEKLRRSQLALYEVMDAKRGQSIQLREIVPVDPDGEAQTHWVYAPILSLGELSKPGTLLGLRLLPGNPWRLTDATYYIPGSWSAGVINEIRRNLELTPHPRDRALAFSVAIISRWFAILTAKPPSLIDRSSGEPILLVTDHYRIEDEQALAEKLQREPDVEADDHGGWVRLEKRAGGGLAPLISLNRGEKQGTLEAFARTLGHADEGRSWLREVAGEAITYLTRDISDPMTLAEATEEEEEGESVEDLMSDFSPEELSAIIEKHYREFYADWAEAPIPALEDQSPTEAAATKQGRQKVEDLLESYEANERRMASEQGREPISFDFLREQVGLG